MTDVITTTPITTRRIRIPHLRVPNLGIAESFEALILVLGDAYGLIYASPFRDSCYQRPAVSDEDLEGRDPSW